MHSVAEHYENLLAPVYVWMAGGLDAALARGRAEMEEVCPRPANRPWAVDLGAGFGMHAIPLADRGYSVLAIDSSGTLLEVMDSHRGDRAIRAVHDDLLAFRRYLVNQPALIVCLGDTLTHLPDRHSVERLIGDVAAMLEPGGMFIAAFRDYSAPLLGVQRFIPVRSDANRILTCFLEYEDETVAVHDILHEREGAIWRQRISLYRKLRLSPAWVAATLEKQGLRVSMGPGAAGMVRLVGVKVPGGDSAVAPEVSP